MQFSTEQKFISLVSTAVLLLVMIFGSCANSWLFYLIRRKRVRFPRNHFATLALGSDLILCVAGTPVFIWKNLLVLAWQPSLDTVLFVACVFGLTVVLFHVLLTTMCLVMEHIHTISRLFTASIRINVRKWRRFGVTLTYGVSCGIPVVFLVVQSVGRDRMMSDSPRCSADVFILPVVFVCFSAILIVVSSALVLAYRMRNSRRVFAVNLRTSIVHGGSVGGERSQQSAISAGINCSVQGRLPLSGSCNDSRTKTLEGASPVAGPSNTHRTHDMYQPGITCKISVEANSAMHKSNTEGVKTGQSSPYLVRKIAVAEATATNCVSTDQNLPPLAENQSVSNDNGDIQKTEACTEQEENESPMRAQQQGISGTPCSGAPLELKPTGVSHSTLAPAHSGTLRLSVVSTISQAVAKEPPGDSGCAQSAAAVDILNLFYSTISWFTVGVLLVVFILQFLTSLFVTKDARSVVQQTSFLILYVAAAVRPFLYVRSQKSLWNTLVKGKLDCCVCGNVYVA